MKNVTVSLDDETYRVARIKAAEAGRSLSSLVRDFLKDLGSGQSEFERLYQEELRLREQITGFSAADNLPRNALHERR
jgi:plasmid stability protein